MRAWTGLCGLLCALVFVGVGGKDYLEVMEPGVCENLTPDNVMLAMASLEAAELALDRFTELKVAQPQFEDIYGEFAFFKFEGKLLVSGYLQGLNMSESYGLRIHKGKTDDLDCSKAGEIIKGDEEIDIGNLGVIDIFINETAVFCFTTDYFVINDGDNGELKDDESATTESSNSIKPFDLANETSMMVVKLPNRDSQEEGTRVVCGSIMPIKEIDMIVMEPSNQPFGKDGHIRVPGAKPEGESSEDEDEKDANLKEGTESGLGSEEGS